MPVCNLNRACRNSVVRLTLAELELTTCSGLTGFLTLNFAGIARQESVLLQNRTELGIDLAQCACDTQTSRLSLPLDTATVQIDGDIVVLCGVGSQQRLLHLELKDVERKIDFQRFAVDRNLPFTRLHEYASHSSLTTTYGIYNFHNSYLISFNLIAFGF